MADSRLAIAQRITRTKINTKLNRFLFVISALMHRNPPGVANFEQWLDWMCAPTSSEEGSGREADGFGDDEGFWDRTSEWIELNREARQRVGALSVLEACGIELSEKDSREMAELSLFLQSTKNRLAQSLASGLVPD